MKILIVGNGGREHALLWKLRRDAPDAEFYITRGNGGTAGLATALPLAPTDVAALAAWAASNGVDLTVVGPEAPLDDGIVDVFVDRGLAIFGPKRAAAAIEASKAYAKALMARAGVPTAAFRTFTELAPAEAFIREMGAPIVVKASGLAAGKGAIVCDTIEDAVGAARAMLAGGEFGAAGSEIVVEECMQGEEVSVFALTDGHDVLTMLPAQDYKRVAEGDTGPNTGGMGAFAPVSRVDAALLDRIRREILLPTLAALRDDGRPFLGLLYAGLMLTADGPKVVEFNARFGDPETEALLPLLRSSLLEPMLGIARGDTITTSHLDWHDGCALTTVLASGGYPGGYEKGKPITIPADIAEADDIVVFHAGTELRDGRLVTAGGRVLAVTAVAPTIEQAAARSRAAAEAIHFEGKRYRRDIGWRELRRRAGVA
ncbi:MAG TPA: phosphoribosylamine--glycine ligase [Longimicrobiales bacterium]